MSALSDLQAAATALVASVTTLDAEIQAAVTAIQSAQAANDDEGVEAAVAQLVAANATVARNAEALASVLPPAPAPAPAPAA